MTWADAGFIIFFLISLTAWVIRVEERLRRLEGKK